MNVQTWLWLTLFVMSLGAAAILLIAKHRTSEEETDGILHGIVPIIAATSYLAMAFGQGSIHLPLGVDPATQWEFYYARYIDWAFTTPILLYALATDAMHSGMRRHGAVFGMLAADVLMIATALFFGASTTAWIKWTWYAVSCGAFLAVYYVIWVPLLQESRKEREDVQAAFRRNAAILSVVWLIYPLVLIVGTDGLKLVSPVVTTALIAVLDVVAKVVFGLMAVSERANIVDRDLNERRPAVRSAPSLAPAE